MASSMQSHPRSIILEKGYLNIYTNLSSQEKRQLFYNREYKKIDPSWDNTLILLTKYFSRAKQSLGLKELKILDAGCGNGNYVVDEFRNDIKFAAGVDKSPEYTAKNICLDEIKYADLTKIPYANNSFDVVLSLWVIEHLQEPLRIFNQINRVLKPGGFFIFSTTHNNFFPIKLKQIINSVQINNLVNNLIYGRKTADIFATQYLANDLETLSNLLTKANFKKIDLRLNYDPSYTSFNKLTFALSNIFYNRYPQPMSPHIAGIFRKA